MTIKLTRCQMSSNELEDNEFEDELEDDEFEDELEDDDYEY